MELSRLRALNRVPLDVLVETASAAVDHYADDLLAEVRASVPSDLTTEAASPVKKCYTELVLEFGRSVRDAETDSVRRHAVAQAVQQKVLEAERRVRTLFSEATAACIVRCAAAGLTAHPHPGVFSSDASHTFRSSFISGAAELDRRRFGTLFRRVAEGVADAAG